MCEGVDLEPLKGTFNVCNEQKQIKMCVNASGDWRHYPTYNDGAFEIWMVTTNSVFAVYLRSFFKIALNVFCRTFAAVLHSHQTSVDSASLSEAGQISWRTRAAGLCSCFRTKNITQKCWNRCVTSGVPVASLWMLCPSAKQHRKKFRYKTFL